MRELTGWGSRIFKGGGGAKELCACSAYPKRESESPLRTGPGPSPPCMGFRCFLLLSNPYFESFNDKKIIKKQSRSKISGGARLLRPRLDPPPTWNKRHGFRELVFDCILIIVFSILCQDVIPLRLWLLSATPCITSGTGWPSQRRSLRVSAQGSPPALPSFAMSCRTNWVRELTRIAKWRQTTNIPYALTSSRRHVGGGGGGEGWGSKPSKQLAHFWQLLLRVILLIPKRQRTPVSSKFAGHLCLKCHNQSRGVDPFFGLGGGGAKVRKISTFSAEKFRIVYV